MCLAYPMKVIEIKGKQALVDARGISKRVNVEFMKDLKKGDYVMVHAGFAIEKLDVKKVKITLEAFREYGNALRESVEK